MDSGYTHPSAPCSSHPGNAAAAGGGTFSNNPLLGTLIKPMYKTERGKEKERDSDASDGAAFEKKKNLWRRVQDDMEDNEAIILDGGTYGGDASDTRLQSDEPART